LLVKLTKFLSNNFIQQMQIIQGSKECLKALNIGSMTSNSNPEQFFPYAQIEILNFHDEVGNSFSEKIFKVPIHI
jgi:ATP-dependent DNA helicase RecG